MKKKITLLVLVVGTLSCNKAKNETNGDDKSINSVAIDTTDLKSKAELTTQNWYDELVLNYIKNSDKDLIVLALKDKEKVDYELDRIEKTDSTKYYIFNIGQDVSEEDGTNTRFSSDGWIYIDSISKKIYEYDLPNDTIIAWKDRHHRK